MKKLLSLPLFMITLAVTAQSLTIDKLSPFDGMLKNLGDGYAFTRMGKKEKEGRPFTIQYYNRKLENEYNITFMVSKSMGLRSIVFNGAVFLTIFEDIKEKNYTYFTHDTDGNELGKKVDAITKWSESDPEVLYADREGFYFFRTIKQDKWGYKVEKVSSSLESDWVHEYIPEKRYATYERPVVHPKGVAFLRPQQATRDVQLSVGPFGRISRASYDLIILDPATGDVSGTYPLLQSGYYLEPTSLCIDPDGSVVMGGMYFNDTWEEKDNSDGTYLLKIAKNGSQQFLNRMAWADASNGLQEFLTTDNKGITFTPKVMYHHITKKDGRYYLIGEVFQEVLSGAAMAVNLVSAATGDDEGGSSIAINLRDFLVLTYSENGELINKARVAKPKRTVYQPENIPKDMVAVGGIDFDFEFIAQDQQFQDVGVAFMGEEKKKMTLQPYFAYFSLEHSGEEIDFGKVSYARKGKFMDGDAKLLLYPHEPGKALLYEYYPSKARLFLEVLEWEN